MPIVIKTKKVAKADVGVEHLTKGQPMTESHEQEDVDTSNLPGQMQLGTTDYKANVGIEVSNTINMGDYNSVRVSCSLRIDCPAEDIDETAAFIEDWVNKKMDSLTSEINATDE